MNSPVSPKGSLSFLTFRSHPWCPQTYEQLSLRSCGFRAEYIGRALRLISAELREGDGVLAEISHL